MKTPLSSRTYCFFTSFMLVCLVLSLVFQACGSKGNPEPQPDSPEETESEDDQHDIYVAGIQKNSNSVSIATYWKNGVATQLSDGQREAVAKSIYISASNDVYVVGYTVNRAGKHVATLWKNGAASYLTDGKEHGDATSVYVSGDAVFVAGYATLEGRATPVYWLNLSMNVLPLEPGSLGGGADAITTYGPDIFTVGHQIPQKAIQWKNKERVILPADGANTFLVSGVAASETSVYVSGTVLVNGAFKARLWKDGVLQPLALGGGISTANGVFILSGNVYVVGSEVESDSRRYGKVWENGRATDLISESNSVEGKAIVVSLGHVYVAGDKLLTDANGRKVVMVWRDGQELKQYSNSTDDAEAYSIFVVKKK